MSEIKHGNVPIHQIFTGVQPRHSVKEEAISEMAASLLANGQLAPIAVEKAENGFLIRWGNTRYLAARKLGWDTILAYVLPPEINAGDSLRMAVVENSVRSQMTFVEQADVIQEYAKLKGFGLTQAGKELGFKQSLVSKCLTTDERLLPANKKKLLDAGVGGSIAYLISQETDPAEQSKLTETVINEKWPRKEVEKYFRAKRQPMTRFEYSKYGGKVVIDMPKAADVECLLSVLKELGKEIQTATRINANPSLVAQILKEASNVA